MDDRKNGDDDDGNRVDGSSSNPGKGIDDGDWLDREHQARVSRVASCDSPEDRKTAAESEMGLLTEDMQYLFAERNAQGSDDYVNAIRRSGWFPYAGSLRSAANLAWLFDLVLWAALWVGVVWQLMEIYKNG